MKRIPALDLAAMACDVYKPGQGTKAAALSWRPLLHLKGDASGFAASLFERDGFRVLAVRGTELSDAADLAADLQMLPKAALDRIAGTLEKIGSVSGRINVFNTGVSLPNELAHVLRAKAGRIPEQQTKAADRFYAELDRLNLRPQAVTGHSLGGALAVTLSQKHNLPAMTFNAPHVGLLQGVVPMTSFYIHHVVRVGCPVVGATKALGSLPVGRVTEVQFPVRQSHMVKAIKRVPGPLAMMTALLEQVGNLLQLHSIDELHKHFANNQGPVLLTDADDIMKSIGNEKPGRGASGSW